MRGLSFLLFCSLLSVGAAWAEQPKEEQIGLVLRWADPARVAGASVDDSVPVIVAFMRRDDVDGVPGLSRRDAELRSQMDGAGRGLEQFQGVLASDLDGNLEVSRAEAEAVARISASQPLRSAAGPVLPDRDQRAALAQRLADSVMQADTDGDGLISQDEIRALAVPPPEDAENLEQRILGQDAARILAWADVDGDTNATPDEMASVVRAVLDLIDSDDDGRITRPELVVFE